MNLSFNGALIPGHRSSWEAVDSGILLWRENFFLFLPFFAVPFWICAFALRLLPGNLQYLSWLILWFLKPLFDRPILHIISIQFFESGAGMKRLSLGLGKSLIRGLPGDLLWRRFSPLRSAMMPVRVLEPGGKERQRVAERKKILKMGGLNFGSFLVFWGAALEIALLCGEVLFFVIMAELIRSGSAYSFWSFFREAEIFIFAAWCFNYMLVETLYVCMGFSLYINSRTQVEGWDIEIMFRSLAEKLKNKKMVSVLIVIVLCLTAGLLMPQKTFAGDLEQAGTGDIPLEMLRSVLDSPDFGGERDSWGIRLKNPVQPEIPDFNFNPALEKLRKILAFSLRLILIAAIAGLAVFLFFYIRKYGQNRIAVTNNTVMGSLPAGIDENPEALLVKAESFFKQGQKRLAWGYCTAAAVKSWSLYRGLVFPPNATENDCVELVSAAKTDEAQTFGELIKHWVNFAYAGRLPPEGSFERAVAFCKDLRASNE